MKLLPCSFNSLTAAGVWRPLAWSFGWKKIIYDCYTIFIVTGLYSYAFMGIVDIVISSIHDITHLVDVYFLVASVINTSLKTANLLINRCKIIDLFAILDSSVCQSRNEEENIIRNNFNRRVKINFVFFFCMINSAVSISTVLSVIQNIPERTLPFAVWVPFYNNSEIGYFMLYVQQAIIGHIFEAIICIGNDTMVTGLMLLTCGQLQALKYRHENLPEILEKAVEKMSYDRDNLEKEYLSELIEYHKTILKFATTANELFSPMIFIQYGISSYVLCISVYRCARMSITDPEYPFEIFYLLCMGTQIFYFCWYGNEVIVESSNIGDSVYKMDWTMMNRTTQKDLIMIMNRASRPIIFTSGNVIELSVESFKGIVKLSYSAFNVLQQT